MNQNMNKRLNRKYKHRRGDNYTSIGFKIILNYRYFKNKYKFLVESQWWSKNKLEKYQLDLLKNLLNHAYQNVPWYHKIFDNSGLKPKDIHNLNDMQKLPFLRKEDIRENLNSLKAKNFPDFQIEYKTTSGSTGTPLGFYREKDISSAMEWAFIRTLWKRIGYQYITDKCMILRDNLVRSSVKGKFWDYSFFGRWLVLSSYHMTEKNLPLYIIKIRKFKPRFIIAYPSALTILARYIKNMNIKQFNSVKAIICSAENLYPWQYDLFHEIFKCRIFNVYGHSEGAVLGGGCEKTNIYHMFPEYGIVELIDKDNKPITEENKKGEIVVTGFNNYIVPFIRYKTGDFGEYDMGSCPCGRNYPLIKNIEGRQQEFIITTDGLPLPLGSILAGINDAKWTMVKEIQLIQEKPGNLIIQFVKDINVDDQEVKNYVYNQFKERIQQRCNLEIRIVDKISRIQSGKYQYFIQKIISKR